MEKDKKLKIVFFGTPEFAVASLGRILAAGHDVAAVVTMPDKIAGRGHKLIESDVKRYATAHGLPVLQPAKLKDPLFLDTLRSLQADIFVVIAFRMLPREVWEMPPMGTVNLHGSLLPDYRGAAPINHAVMNGDTATGVTTFQLQHEIDTGDILLQAGLPIADDENVGSVHDRMMLLGAEVMERTLEGLASGTIEPRPQPEGEHRPAPKIFKEDCRINWERGREAVHNFVRGLSPYPAAWTEATEAGKGDVPETRKQREIKILATTLASPDAEYAEGDHPAPGTVEIRHGHLLAACADGWIEIISLRPAGKPEMSAKAYLAGNHPLRFD